MNLQKKKTFALLALGASFSAVQAMPFNGFYLGGFVGAEKTFVQSNAATSKNIEVENAFFTYTVNESIKREGKSRENSFQYGLTTGYGVNANNAYLGLEVTLHHGTGGKSHQYNVKEVAVNGKNITEDFSEYFKNYKDFSQGGSPASIRYERGPVLGIAPRIGCIMGRDFLLFAKLGLEISRDKLSVTVGHIQARSATP